MSVQWEAPEEPAGPAPGYEFGSFGARLVAYIVDILIAVALIILIVIIGSAIIAGGAISGSGAATGGGILITFIAVLAVSIGYFPWFWARRGATPGMNMMGLRVVRDRDGGAISSGQAILRMLGYWVSGAVFYLGYIWIFIDKRRRGWHDLIAGTVVIKRV